METGKKVKAKPGADRITRRRLRQMRDGEAVQVKCRDFYDLESQKSSAYAAQKLLGCKFSCKGEGLLLTVTRHDGAPGKGGRA